MICLLVVYSLLIISIESKDVSSTRQKEKQEEKFPSIEIDCKRCQSGCIYAHSALDCLIYQIFCTGKTTKDTSTSSSECEMLKGQCMFDHNTFACVLYSILNCK